MHFWSEQTGMGTGSVQPQVAQAREGGRSRGPRVTDHSHQEAGHVDMPEWRGWIQAGATLCELVPAESWEPVSLPPTLGPGWTGHGILNLEDWTQPGLAVLVGVWGSKAEGTVASCNARGAVVSQEVLTMISPEPSASPPPMCSGEGLGCGRGRQMTKGGTSSPLPHPTLPCIPGPDGALWPWVSTLSHFPSFLLYKLG